MGNLINGQKKSRFKELAGLNENKQSQRQRLNEQADKMRQLMGEVSFTQALLESLSNDELEEKLSYINENYRVQ
jgi:hypothetical protein